MVLGVGAYGPATHIASDARSRSTARTPWSPSRDDCTRTAPFVNSKRPRSLDVTLTVRRRNASNDSFVRMGCLNRRGEPASGLYGA